MKNKDTQLKLDLSMGPKKGLKVASKLQAKVQRRIDKAEAKLRDLRSLQANINAFVQGASNGPKIAYVAGKKNGPTTPKGRLRGHGKSIATVLRAAKGGLTSREIARKLHTPDSGIKFPQLVTRTSQHLTRLKGAGKVELNHNGTREGVWSLSK